MSGPLCDALCGTDLELLRRPEALHLPVHHDGDAGAQGLALLHAENTQTHSSRACRIRLETKCFPIQV